MSSQPSGTCRALLSTARGRLLRPPHPCRALVRLFVRASSELPGCQSAMYCQPSDSAFSMLDFRALGAPVALCECLSNVSRRESHIIHALRLTPGLLHFQGKSSAISKIAFVLFGRLSGDCLPYLILCLESSSPAVQGQGHILGHSRAITSRYSGR